MSSDKTDIELSVIIASHRRDYIAGCLRALLTSISKVERSEIIVVCDYPPGTLAHQYTSVKWHTVYDKSIPVKRNLGISLAGAPIVAFVDDDCRPEPLWAHNALTCFRENADIAGVEGATTIQQTDNRSYAVPEYRRLEKQGYRTNNIFYRTRILRMCGMFDERFAFQREDMDLAFTILRFGLEIHYSHAVRVKHLVRSGEPWDLLKNCWNRRYDPLLFKKHPVEYRRYIQSPIPPGIGLLSGSYLAGATAVFTGAGRKFLSRNERLQYTTLGHLLLLLFVVSRKIRGTAVGIPGSVPLLIAYAMSPFVLFLALLFGSCRYRKFLLF